MIKLYSAVVRAACIPTEWVGKIGASARNFSYLLYFPLILTLGGCAGTLPGEAPGTRQELVLGILSVFVFLGVLIYSAYKAFVELNVSYTERDRAEYKSRAFGFFIGLLLTALIIAADTEQSPFSTSRALASFPWYIFSCLGILLGFTVALASGILAYFRNSSGGGLIVLVLSFIGSSGLYLTVFAGEARASVFALFVSILIGIFAFRMVFPTGLGRPPTREEARQ
jgi:hypothetical protein